MRTNGPIKVGRGQLPCQLFRARRRPGHGKLDTWYTTFWSKRIGWYVLIRGLAGINSIVRRVNIPRWTPSLETLRSLIHCICASIVSTQETLPSMWEQKVCQQVTYLVNINRDLLTHSTHSAHSAYFAHSAHTRLVDTWTSVLRWRCADNGSGRQR